MSEIIFGAVENGARVQVEFPWYKGPAGLQRTEAGEQVAYRNRTAVRTPAKGVVDGVPVEVIAAERSRSVEGFTVLTIRRLVSEA